LVCKNPNSYEVDPKVGTLVDLDKGKGPMVMRDPGDTMKSE